MNEQPKQVGSRFRRLDAVIHVRTKEEDSKELPYHVIKQARHSGQLNLSGRGLAFVPERVWGLDDLEESEVQTLDVKLDHDLDSDRWWEHELISYLDLSSNRLAEISPDIKKLYGLSSLYLQDNSFENLPEELGTLSKLTRLNVSHNKISRLPDSLYQLAELRVLIVNHNKMEVVHVDMSNLVMLDQLDLSHNSISALPPGLGYLIRLTQLNLSFNKLTELPPDVVNLRVLLELNLSYNELVTLPPLGELRRMELLYVENNKLIELPNMTGCENLKEVHLSENNIKEIVLEHLEGLHPLKVLNLRDNKLTELPNGMTCLQNLVRLDLTNNCLSGLPSTLSLLPHLQGLQLDGNPLATVRRDLLQSGTMRLLRHLRQKLETEMAAGVDISGLMPGACILPGVSFPDKYTMRTGHLMNLTNQNLSDVAAEQFKEARDAEVITVDLSKNKFVKVPDGLEELKGLMVTLNLCCNLLKSIPACLGACQRLQFLDLQTNELSDLPKELGGLEMLRELNISYNRFTELPTCVFEISGLQILEVSNNKITEIYVEGLQKLTRLATLNLSNNSITQVPPELGTLLQLKCLELSGNSFRTPRYSIMAKSTPEVLAYLRDRMPASSGR